MRVLVVDDHDEVRDLVARALARDGHAVTCAVDVATGAAQLRTNAFDVVVLDVALPDGSGVDLCRNARREGATMPVLLLTAHADVPSRVAGLDAGADDFLGKPFAVAELRARVRALARRGPAPRARPVSRAGVELDFAGRRAKLEGREVPITAREWAILELLAARSGQVVRREEILDSVWGEDTERAAASLEVLVGRIRKKLGEALVRTVRGEGYALDGDG